MSDDFLTEMNSLHKRSFGTPLVVLEGAVILVPLVDEKRVGMASMYPTSDESCMVVYDVCVDPSHRGNGYGKEILRMMYDWCLENKKTSMILLVKEYKSDGEKLAKFYTSNFISQEVGNFAYQGMVKSGISVYMWKRGEFTLPKNSIIRRLYDLYKNRITLPGSWLNCITEKIPLYSSKKNEVDAVPL